MNRDEILIRDLESWAAQIVALYESAEDMEGADDLQAVVTCYTADLRRKMQGVTGKLADLADIKRGIRLAGFLLQAIQDDEPVAMAGWRYLSAPQNIVQETYSVVYEIVQNLTASVLCIEREHPDLAGEFALERAAYRASLDQFEAETRFKIVAALHGAIDGCQSFAPAVKQQHDGTINQATSRVHPG